MTALVELFLGRLARARLIEREKEHAALGAEAFLVAGRVPARREAFGREHDEPSAGLGDCVAACLFERAHEGREACAAGSDPRGGFERGVPGVAAFGCCAVAFEGRYHRQAQYLGVSVGEPSAAKELDGLDTPKELRVGLSRPGAGGVFANVAAKGGELAVALHDPIMPCGGEDRGGPSGRADVTARSRTLHCVLRGAAMSGSVRSDNLPIFCGEGLFELVDVAAKRLAFRVVFYLHHEMKVVGHDREWRDFIEAAPLEVKATNDFGEGSRQIVFDEAIWPDFGKCLKALKPLKGHHVEIWRAVVETFEANHADSLPYFSDGAHRAQGPDALNTRVLGD